MLTSKQTYLDTGKQETKDSKPEVRDVKNEGKLVNGYGEDSEQHFEDDLAKCKRSDNQETQQKSAERGRKSIEQCRKVDITQKQSIRVTYDIQTTKKETASNDKGSSNSEKTQVDDLKASIDENVGKKCSKVVNFTDRDDKIDGREECKRYREEKIEETPEYEEEVDVGYSLGFQLQAEEFISALIKIRSGLSGVKGRIMC